MRIYINFFGFTMYNNMYLEMSAVTALLVLERICT